MNSPVNKFASAYRLTRACNITIFTSDIVRSAVTQALVAVRLGRLTARRSVLRVSRAAVVVSRAIGVLIVVATIAGNFDY